MISRYPRSPWHHLLIAASAVLLPVGAGLADDDPSSSANPPYWGIGRYNLNDAGTIEDHARWDWAVIRFGGTQPTAESLAPFNRFLEANPNQKYLVRLMPPQNGRHPTESRLLNFLDDRYDKALREATRDELRKQIAAVLTYLSKPENVVGFTFLAAPAHTATATLVANSAVRIHDIFGRW